MSAFFSVFAYWHVYVEALHYPILHINKSRDLFDFIIIIIIIIVLQPFLCSLDSFFHIFLIIYIVCTAP
jgi:hypothetical protein